jgi:hypothetical protein
MFTSILGEPTRSVRGAPIIISLSLGRFHHVLHTSLWILSTGSSIASAALLELSTMFAKQDNRLIFSYDADKLWIEPWGKNALRIRATQLNQMPSENWALERSSGPSAVIEIGEKASSLSNGELRPWLQPRAN